MLAAGPKHCLALVHEKDKKQSTFLDMILPKKDTKVEMNITLKGWGENTLGQISIDTAYLYKKIYNPVEISCTSKYKFIACGDNHSAGIDVEEKLWVWGSKDAFGAYFNGHSEMYENDTRILNGQLMHKKLTEKIYKVEKVHLSSNYNLVFYNDHPLFYWQGKKGQKETEKHFLQKVKAHRDFHTVAIGLDHSLAISKDQARVYSWGSDLNFEEKIISDYDKILVCNICELMASQHYKISSKKESFSKNRNQQSNSYIDDTKRNPSIDKNARATKLLDRKTQKMSSINITQKYSTLQELSQKLQIDKKELSIHEAMKSIETIILKKPYKFLHNYITAIKRQSQRYRKTNQNSNERTSTSRLSKKKKEIDYNKVLISGKLGTQIMSKNTYTRIQHQNFKGWMQSQSVKPTEVEIITYLLEKSRFDNKNSEDEKFAESQNYIKRKFFTKLNKLLSQSNQKNFDKKNLLNLPLFEQFLESEKNVAVSTKLSSFHISLDKDMNIKTNNLMQSNVSETNTQILSQNWNNEEINTEKTLAVEQKTEASPEKNYQSFFCSSEYLNFCFDKVKNSCITFFGIVQRIEKYDKKKKSIIKDIRASFFKRIFEEPFNKSKLIKVEKSLQADVEKDKWLSHYYREAIPMEILINIKAYQHLFTAFHFHPCMFINILKWSNEISEHLAINYRGNEIIDKKLLRDKPQLASEYVDLIRSCLGGDINGNKRKEYLFLSILRDTFRYELDKCKDINNVVYNEVQIDDKNVSSYLSVTDLNFLNENNREAEQHLKYTKEMLYFIVKSEIVLPTTDEELGGTGNNDEAKSFRNNLVSNNSSINPNKNNSNNFTKNQSLKTIYKTVWSSMKRYMNQQCDVDSNSSHKFGYCFLYNDEMERLFKNKFSSDNVDKNKLRNKLELEYFDERLKRLKSFYDSFLVFNDKVEKKSENTSKQSINVSQFSIVSKGIKNQKFFLKKNFKIIRDEIVKVYPDFKTEIDYEYFYLDLLFYPLRRKILKEIKKESAKEVSKCKSTCVKDCKKHKKKDSMKWNYFNIYLLIKLVCLKREIEVKQPNYLLTLIKKSDLNKAMVARYKNREECLDSLCEAMSELNESFEQDNYFGYNISKVEKSLFKIHKEYFPNADNISCNKFIRKSLGYGSLIKILKYFWQKKIFQNF